jgi:outer membrane protein assembly factor BamA
LALRGTGETIEGTFPYYDAVYLGGKETLRGFRMRRFAGNSALSGSAEARLLIKRIFLIFPGDFGIMAFTDFGRAWFNDASPGGWHNSAGGGIFLAPLYRQFTISFAAASSVEGLLLNGGLGFAF